MKTHELQITENLTHDEQTTCEISQPDCNLTSQPDCQPDRQSASQPNSQAPFPTKSTVPSKLPPDLLAAIHEALLAPERLSYHRIFDDFQLHKKGVSYGAFFNYARPIRLRDVCTTQASLGRTLGPDTVKMVPDLIATRLLAALVDESITPRQIKNLVDAYATATNLNLAYRRREQEKIDKLKKSKSTELADLARTFKEYSRATRAELKQSKPQAIEEDNDE